MPKYLSGRSKVTPQSKLQSDRYRYLSIENAEPNLGDPLVGLSSVTAKPVPPGNSLLLFPSKDLLQEKDIGFPIKVELYLVQLVFLMIMFWSEH